MAAPATKYQYHNHFVFVVIAVDRGYSSDGDESPIYMQSCTEMSKKELRMAHEVKNARCL
jgi:hypothetical protein